AGMFGVFCFATSMIHTLENPNLTEVYALPLQFGLFALFIGKNTPRSAFFAGILACALFTFRQNIGTAGALAVAAVLLRPAWIATVRHGLYFVAGAAAALAPALLYFGANGALGEAYTATIGSVFQSGVVSASWTERYQSLANGL